MCAWDTDGGGGGGDPPPVVVVSFVSHKVLFPIRPGPGRERPIVVGSPWLSSRVPPPPTAPSLPGPPAGAWVGASSSTGFTWGTSASASAAWPATRPSPQGVPRHPPKYYPGGHPSGDPTSTASWGLCWLKKTAKKRVNLFGCSFRPGGGWRIIPRGPFGHPFPSVATAMPFWT